MVGLERCAPADIRQRFFRANEPRFLQLSPTAFRFMKPQLQQKPSYFKRLNSGWSGSRLDGSSRSFKVLPRQTYHVRFVATGLSWAVAMGNACTNQISDVWRWGAVSGLTGRTDALTLQVDQKVADQHASTKPRTPKKGSHWSNPSRPSSKSESRPSLRARMISD